jgi:hypothetical protein
LLVLGIGADWFNVASSSAFFERLHTNWLAVGSAIKERQKNLTEVRIILRNFDETSTKDSHFRASYPRSGIC